VRFPRLARASVGIAVLIVGATATLDHPSKSSASVPAAQAAGHWVCVSDIYGQNPADGTGGCPPNQYPVWVVDQTKLNYVAMGDSYSSGESVPPYFDGSGLDSVIGNNSRKNGCDRSETASNYWISNELPYIGFPQVDSQFIACDGETTDQILGLHSGTEIFDGKGGYGEQSQLIQLAKVDTLAFGSASPDLITLTAAGDDVGFVSVLVHCAVRGCAAPFSTYVSGVTAKIRQDTAKLAITYATIAHNASSNTSVLVANYPSLMPPSAHDCNSLHTVLDEGSQSQINQWGIELDSSIATATREAGVNYVNVLPTFAGHYVCAHNAWINGIIAHQRSLPVINFPPPGYKGSFHPNLRGQQGYATAFVNYIQHSQLTGKPTTPAGLPANPGAITANAVSHSSGPAVKAVAAPAAAVAAAPVYTVDGGNLTVAPHVADPASCPELFQGGEMVDVTGDGYAPGAAVTLSIMPTTPEVVTEVVTADADGHLATTIQLPAVLTGLAVDSAGYVEAEGPGSDATTQSNDALFSVGSADANCGIVLPPPASATVSLFGTADPAAPASGAVFAVTGPGLPVTSGNPPAPGTFAELDTSSDGTTVCPATEPTGVTCADGALDALTPAATYTVTEIVSPSGYANAAPQTFQAATDPTTSIVGFVNKYIGPPLPASLAVALTASDESGLPAGAVFAVSGPGLPAVGATPTPGTFAELDTTSYTPSDPTAGATTTCPAAEPAGVTCADGMLQSLNPGTNYTVTEVTAPPGYALAPPQTVTTWTDGSPTEVTFGNSPQQQTPTITWLAPALVTYGTPLSSAQLNATSTIAGTFAYTPSAGTVLGAGAHQLSVVFTPTNTVDYKTATATVTFSVAKATPTLTWSPQAGILYGTSLSSAQLNATSSVPGALTYVPGAGTVLQPGIQTLTAAFAPTDIADYNPASATRQITVGFTQPCITTTRTGAMNVAAGQSFCVGVGGKITGAVTISAGGALWVSGGTVTGTISSAGQLWVSAGTITGAVSATTGLTMCATRLTGPMTVSGSNRYVLVGGSGCAGNTITGAVAVTNNTGGVSFSGNKVTGSLTITGNRGGLQYSGNTVSGSVNVSGNS
jgi:hypothetical protein